MIHNDKHTDILESGWSQQFVNHLSWRDFSAYADTRISGSDDGKSFAQTVSAFLECSHPLRIPLRSDDTDNLKRLMYYRPSTPSEIEYVAAAATALLIHYTISPDERHGRTEAMYWLLQYAKGRDTCMLELIGFIKWAREHDGYSALFYAVFEWMLYLHMMKASRPRILRELELYITPGSCAFGVPGASLFDIDSGPGAARAWADIASDCGLDAKIADAEIVLLRSLVSGRLLADCANDLRSDVD